MIFWKHKFDRKLEKILLVLESAIALAATIVLVCLLCVELFRIAADPASLLGEDGLPEFLHSMLTIVVGLEFVKLLMHVTPENVLEVLIMAVARHFITGDGSAMDDLLSVLCVLLCIGGIILYRRFGKVAHFDLVEQAEHTEKQETPQH